MRYNGTCSAGVAHLAERHLAKVEVASSNLVARSKAKILLTNVGGIFALYYSFFSFRYSLFISPAKFSK